MSHSLKYRFLEFVNFHQLIEKEQRILAAVSGGVDSMVLLHLLSTWRKYFQIELGVVHFNHQLRGKQSDADEQFVKKTAGEMGIPFFSDRGDVTLFARQHQYSIEEAARVLREQFFERCLEMHQYDRIATAHTLNDQAETVLMHLLSGAGLQGLAGIRLRRGKIIRPLLFAERPEIRQYAQMHEIHFREDPTNRDIRFVRNKIRHHLLPFLEKEFQLRNLQPFLRTGIILQEWLASLEEEFPTIFDIAVIPESENKIGLDIAIYNRYFSLFKIKLIEEILLRLTGKERKLTYQKLVDFTKWLNLQGQGSRFRFYGQISARLEGDCLWFENLPAEKTVIPVDEEIPINSICRIDPLNLHIEVSAVEAADVSPGKEKGVEFLDAQHLTFPLKLRNWKAGDKFQPLGMTTPKKVSDFLTDEKKLLLPKRQMLVLESNGEIVCVVGARISEKYKITEHTQKAIRVKVSKE